MKPILRRLLGLASNQTPIDPARFGDPLALKTEWTPASRGGSNFRTHRLIQTEFTRVEFKASGWAKVFYTFFALAGIGFIVVFTLIRKPPSFSIDFIMPMFVGAIFTLMGGAMLYAGTAPIVFDKGIGYFWKGRKGPQDVLEVSSLKKCARLEQIHAIQLVSEFVRTGKSSYYSYELNLVLEDARRITVIDHGNLLRLQEDAKKLSDFLGKPIWDAVERPT
jgi:hypothetical protein